MEDPSADPKWYEDWFDRDEYKIVYSHRDEEDARQVVDLIEQAVHPAAGDRIVDVGCGRGRHAIELARRGYKVTGIDLSERSIAEARQTAAAEGVTVEFQVGDMRRPICDACFDGGVNLFTAFGYFEREEEHEDAIIAIADALKPGGWFVQDFMNPKYVRDNLVISDTTTRGDVEIEQRRTLREGRIRKDIILRHNGRERLFSESVRLFELADFRRMYEKSGLEIEAVFGNYDGGPFTERAPRMIILSRKLPDEKP